MTVPEALQCTGGLDELWFSLSVLKNIECTAVEVLGVAVSALRTPKRSQTAEVSADVHMVRAQMVLPNRQGARQE